MRASALRHIVFDLDGTLVDSLPGIEWSVRRAAEDVLGMPERLCPSIVRFIGPPIERMVPAAFPGHTPEQHQMLVAAFRRRYDHEGWRRSSVYPGVPQILEALRTDSVHLYVLTNKRLEATTRILEHLGLRSLFRSITAPSPPDLVFSHKGEALARLLELERASPTSTCMVGDSEDDLRAALTTGTAFVGATYGYGRVGELELGRGHPMIRDIEQLPGILYLPKESRPAPDGQCPRSR